MTPFPWVEFFQAQGIPYITSGPHVSQGNIAINCPYCASDQKHHMGVSLSGKGYGCWRSADHRGKSPVRLIQELLQVPQSEAIALVREYTGTVISDFHRVTSVWNPTASLGMAPDHIAGLQLPTIFEEPRVGSAWQDPYFDYLVGRGVPEDHLGEFCRTYELCFARTGEWCHRILIPIYADARIIAWTGRSIDEDPFLRWKTLSCRGDNSGNEATMSNKEVLGNEQHLTGGRVLIITEGPFDYLLPHYFGHKQSIHFSCLFGKAPTVDQLDRIEEIAPQYNRVCLMLDAETGLDGLALALRLPGVSFIEVPAGCSDPGELSRHQIQRFVKQMR